MTSPERVAKRYAATLAKWQQKVIEALKAGGYLEKSKHSYGGWHLFDARGKPIGHFKDLPILKMLDRNILDDGKNRDTLILHPMYGKRKPRRKAGPPEGTAGYIGLGVLAGAYSESVQEGKTMLIHAIWVSKGGDWLGDGSVCGRLSYSRLADVGEPEITCKTCAARVRKAGLPHMRQHQR